MMDYWTASLDKSIIIGVRESGEKLLVKSEDEYTSPIANIYKVETEYIIVTENSIYLISNETPSKKISWSFWFGLVWFGLFLNNIYILFKKEIEHFFVI